VVRRPHQILVIQVAGLVLLRLVVIARQ